MHTCIPAQTFILAQSPARDKHLELVSSQTQWILTLHTPQQNADGCSFPFPTSSIKDVLCICNIIRVSCHALYFFLGFLKLLNDFLKVAYIKIAVKFYELCQRVMLCTHQYSVIQYSVMHPACKPCP